MSKRMKLNAEKTKAKVSGLKRKIPNSKVDPCVKCSKR